MLPLATIIGEIMEKNNSAVYECPKSSSGVHHWIPRDNKTAYCKNCKRELDEYQAADVFRAY